MMRKLLLVLLCVCGVVTTWAQPRVPREWDFGAVGGVNLSTYNFAPTVLQSQSSGYTAGVAVRYIEEKYFGLEAELLVTKRGMRDRFDEELAAKYSFVRNLTYVEMPVNAHVYFNLGSRSEIALDLGPKIGYYLSDTQEAKLDASFDVYANRTRHKYSHHSLEVSNKVDYGIQAGLGYEFKFTNSTSFQLQGRYYFGLGNIFPDAKGNYFEESSNRSIQIVGTLWFRHKVRLKNLNL